MKMCIVMMFVFFAVGCSVNASKMGREEARGVADSLTYIRDVKTGLCFAVVASRQTGTVNSTGMGLAHVPCDSVK